MLPYTIEEITRRVAPVAQKYGLAAVYLFGSYARGDATADSDVDLLVDISGTEIDSLLKLGGLYCDLEDALETSIDLVTLDSMDEPTDRRSQLHFREAVKRERKMIYAAA
jgi:predicted nucleotidyltransferase